MRIRALLAAIVLAFLSACLTFSRDDRGAGPVSADVPVASDASSRDAATCVDDRATQSCGLGACQRTVPKCRLGRPLRCEPDVNQQVPETCDGVDNDCNGVVDDAPESALAGSICRASTARCEPSREVTITQGAQALRLGLAPRDACPTPLAATAMARTWNETVVVRVPATVAVALSSPDGVLRVVSQRDGAARTELESARDVCAPGVYTGVAVLGPGVYALVAVDDGATRARSVSVEAVAVPEGTPAPVPPGVAHVAMSTTGMAAPPTDCRRDANGDARVLVCPTARSRSAGLSSPQGFVASIENATTRTCYQALEGDPQVVALPPGAIVVVRAFAYGFERGPAFVDLLR